MESTLCVIMTSSLATCSITMDNCSSVTGLNRLWCQLGTWLLPIHAMGQLLSCCHVISIPSLTMAAGMTSGHLEQQCSALWWDCHSCTNSQLPNVFCLSTLLRRGVFQLILWIQTLFKLYWSWTWILLALLQVWMLYHQTHHNMLLLKWLSCSKLFSTLKGMWVKLSTKCFHLAPTHCIFSSSSYIIYRLLRTITRQLLALPNDLLEMWETIFYPTDPNNPPTASQFLQMAWMIADWTGGGYSTYCAHLGHSVPISILLLPRKHIIEPADNIQLQLSLPTTGIWNGSSPVTAYFYAKNRKKYIQ